VCADNSARVEGSKVSVLDELIEAIAGHTTRLNTFRELLATSLRSLLGDAILAAAIITYAGDLGSDQKVEMLEKWQIILKSHTVCSKEDFSLASFVQTCKQMHAVQPKGVMGLDAAMQTSLYACSLARQQLPLLIDADGEGGDLVRTLEEQGQARPWLEVDLLNAVSVDEALSSAAAGSAVVVRIDMTAGTQLLLAALVDGYRQSGAPTASHIILHTRCVCIAHIRHRLRVAAIAVCQADVQTSQSAFMEAAQ
jgi:hypothetical protein